MKMSGDMRAATRRWVHEGSGGDLEAELGEVFRATAEQEPLTAAELERVRRRLRTGRARRSRPGFRLWPVVLAVLTGGAGAALAQWARPGIWDISGIFLSRSASPHGAARSGRAVGKSAGAAAPQQPSLPVPQPVGDGRAAFPADSAAAPSEPPAARVTAADSAVGEPNAAALESELLQRALEKLRRDHDGASALRLLDEHGARFPGGVLALEAAVTRIDALLMLGQRAEALERLNRLPLARVGRRTELQLLRAELQAEQDCSKALADFDAVLAASASSPFAERALYGRATCRFRLGDAAGGRRDLDQYLASYPQGRFANQVRARVAGTPK
jgi:hypothetical protein